VYEKAVLASAQVQAAFKAKDVVLVKADWTRRDPVVSEALRAFGRAGVPLYVVYRGSAAPQILPMVVTPALVAKALE
jgi:thiol:disulfide interchange protein DsbD